MDYNTNMMLKVEWTLCWSIWLCELS